MYDWMVRTQIRGKSAYMILDHGNEQRGLALKFGWLMTAMSIAFLAMAIGALIKGGADPRTFFAAAIILGVLGSFGLSWAAAWLPVLEEMADRVDNDPREARQAMIDREYLEDAQAARAESARSNANDREIRLKQSELSAMYDMIAQHEASGNYRNAGVLKGRAAKLESELRRLGA